MGRRSPSVTWRLGRGFITKLRSDGATEAHGAHTPVPHGQAGSIPVPSNRSDSRRERSSINSCDAVRLRALRRERADAVGYRQAISPPRPLPVLTILHRTTASTHAFEALNVRSIRTGGTGLCPRRRASSECCLVVRRLLREQEISEVRFLSLRRLKTGRSSGLPFLKATPLGVPCLSSSSATGGLLGQTRASHT